ncbi:MULTISPECIES: helix-turn-helix transcriptional regulator [Aliivibrio]|uniref:AraC family transcriptional regulator n=1 Tax=Aliivibrio finisterrensis TaxID=511998 RepID=A0A4Q5KX75_9GAMM|nr:MULTISPECIES: AraC family transcriptional regulator [Aliivibrio]MDD9178024.1 AraC family transcriptional regulator [Aliivibrio sp. A6]RYU51979.1 AraC family transcriptional regulator [Aliivibrio finisterrensis]RYU53690.1 AraC family transcriptional regulator [Aliivibrio finisterrensis]RYU57693.1 AraC family transcriptional regulator [Aliivibrio finisterrensis]RYU66135.1 AraC family transcriptional regulator [Aliivibrio finisterrensis]
MGLVFNAVLEALLSERESFNQIWFAGDKVTPPSCCYQVNFPRLELVISGEYLNQIEDPDIGISEVKIMAGDALYIPPNCWNKPVWSEDCSVLSLLFGRRQVGFSLVSKRKGEEGFYDVQKYSIQTRTGHAIDNILEALNALAREPNKNQIDEYLLLALLSYSKSMLGEPNEVISPKKRSEDLYQGICIYIQENFHRSIDRNNIANRFNISPNHLSRMFRQQGHMTLADYITWVRIERAKFMLKKYTFRLTEVATRCGFQDVNYFYRVFKKKTSYTPSDYRTMVK